MELKQKFNFDKLLEPYQEGGSEESPIQRTMGTITSKLMVSYRIPPDIVGLAIYKVFYKIANEGLKFKGNGKYGSKGKELFSCIKAQCLDITQNQCADKVKEEVLALAVCTDKKCRFRTQVFEKPDLKYKLKRFFGMRSGWFSVFITVSPIIGVFLLCLFGMG